MREFSKAAGAPGVVTWTRSVDFLELTKPRITFLVVVTTLVGFYLGAEANAPMLRLANTLLGTALVAGGASALNMLIERKLDALMRRTEQRPLPAGRLQATDALRFGAFISLAGMAYLFAFVNPLTSLLSVVTWATYLFVYTPLKRQTPLCTLVGAVPGALPATMGWAAATGNVSSPSAWLLFTIVFAWQLPHFYAIGWIYRDDYGRAGYPMLPVVDATGIRTGRQTVVFAVLLVAFSMGPVVTGVGGWVYGSAALALGGWFVLNSIRFARRTDMTSARRLFITSVCYLPVLMAVLMADRTT